MRHVVLALLVALLVPTVAHAQHAPKTPAERRESIKKKIRAMRAYTLTEELSLDAGLAGKLFPLLAKWDDVTDKLLVARTDLTRQLAAADAIRDPRAVDRLIDEAVANQKAFWDLETQRLVELRKILTPAQTAKLLIVLPTFERRIQNRLQRVINRAGGRHKGSPSARGDDTDDDDDDVLRGERDDAPAPPHAAPPPATTKPACDTFSSPHGCNR